MRNVYFISLVLPLIILCSTVRAEESLLEQVTPAVVFLHGDGVATTPKDGKIYENWLKLPDSTNTIPLPRTIQGTGFLVVDKGSPYFLVTAEHVARRLTPVCSATIQAQTARPFTISLAKLAGSTNGLHWTTHGQADVAVLSLSPDRDTFDKHLRRHFMPLGVMSKGKNAPPRHIALTALGFPLALGVQGKFSPISRTSKPASGTIVLPRFDTKVPVEFFLLEDTSIGGFSGGPLFDIGGAHFGADGSIIARRSQLKCVGLIHGAIGDQSGKMTAVVPSYYVLETIEKAKKAALKK